MTTGRQHRNRNTNDPNTASAGGRRTIAWYIARLPGGRIALALQYGHLRTTVSSGYSNRARHGLRRVLDIETARAIAYLQHLDQRLNGGDGVSGPAAGRLIRSARSAARFEGMFLGKPEIRALLHEPEFQVFDNPDAFLTCNKDPAKALCDPDRATRAPKDTRPPSLDRCNPACANIARTDQHIADARVEVARLRRDVADPLTPLPLRARLEQRIVLSEVVPQVEAHRAHRHDPTPRAHPHPHNPKAVMNHDDEREAITEAMRRLFAGTPIRSSGNLDIVALAEEAGLKRNKLTHKHTDLRDAFYAERARRAGVSEREIKLQEQIAQLTQRLNDTRAERDNYRTTSEVFARAMNVLTIENQNLRTQLARAQTGVISPMKRRRTGRPDSEGEVVGHDAAALSTSPSHPFDADLNSPLDSPVLSATPARRPR